MQALGEAIRRELVQACHDLSEGGLAVAAAEMALASLLGATLDVGSVLYDEGPRAGGTREAPEVLSIVDYVRNATLLFSESASRFLVEVTPGQREAFKSYMRSQSVHDIALVGRVTDTERLIIRNGKQTLLDVPVHALQEAWKGEQA
jgi:phosphoribosylformylglycinamidine synthase subunit PurSL